MTPFFDPTRCPICVAPLPVRPLRCPTCGVELTGNTVADLVTTLLRADSLVGQIKAQMQPAAVGVPSLSQPYQSQPTLQQPPVFPPPSSPSRPAGQPPARSWFAGKSVSVILLILGALCVLAAGVVFIATNWTDLPLAVRTLILVLITAGFGLASYLALQRSLQATAEALAATAAGMFILDLSAARRVGLFNLDDLAAGHYELLAGVLLVLVAGAGAFAVRSREHWLSSLDAVVGLGLARAALGALRLAGDSNPAVDSNTELYALALVTVTVVASFAYVAGRRFRFPIATWSSAVIGAMAWTAAVAIGAQRAADNAGSDLARIVDGWPALAMALVAGIWSIRVSDAQARRVAACLTLAPALLIFEIVGWSHGWIVGTVFMLAAFAVAALASGRVPRAWSSAVGAAALVLGLSSIVGLLPAILTLAAQLMLAMFGSWRAPTVLPLGLASGDVGPWLLPVTTAVVLALLPAVTIRGHRVSIGRPRVAGAFVAALSVLPILYGAGFWVSLAVLVAVAALLLCAARLLDDDVLLVLGLLVLVIMRVGAYYDDLADPLAWTLIAVAALAWALSERRPEVVSGFLAVSGLFALFGTAQWLTFAEVPWPYQGLVVVAVGSLGLVASQSLRQRRLVCEGLAVTWVLVGLAMAHSSPSNRALELTIVGVATGIMGYLASDRRRAGWVSGVLLTLASWIRLTDSNVQTVEWYTLPAAAALLVYGIRRLRHVPDESTWRALAPGLALALTPSLLLALDEPVSWRGLLVGLASVALVGLGVRTRLAAPFALGAVGTGLLALRYVWPVAAYIPRWGLLFVIGGALLAAGMTWESRVTDVRTARRYIRGLA